MCIKQRGFTLIELIMVMVLMGILTAVSLVFILQPFQAAADLERRASLVDAADLALNRMTREARNALPNSVRVHNASHVEFVSTVGGGRYRRLPATDGSGQILIPAKPAGDFDVLGALFGAIQPLAAGTNCAGGSGHCVSIYNTGQPGFDVYQQQNIAAIEAITISNGTTTISYVSGQPGSPAFATHSPQQRFYIVGEVVSYVCAAGQLRRHSGYGLHADMPPPLTGGELVATNVDDCQFSYAAGTSARRGLLTLRLDFERGGERIFLLAQSQVLNAP